MMPERSLFYGLAPDGQTPVPVSASAWASEGRMPSVARHIITTAGAVAAVPLGLPTRPQRSLLALVSTVFLGIDAAPFASEPILWETIVFVRRTESPSLYRWFTNPRITSAYEQRYAVHAAALARHEELIGQIAAWVGDQPRRQSLDRRARLLRAFLDSLDNI